ncbi:MAG TPA: T9SS type A sorting domain-containing protein, partial [Saprospiraceae bacterium]|nr:T9SS type A sorting domain-containing protein [Saprospiraceae bacterium]
FTGPSEICVGETTTVIPNTGGTWTSSNPAVATISNSGLVTGINVGTATLIQYGQNCTTRPITVTVKNMDCNPAAVRSDLYIFSFVDYNGNGIFDANEDNRLPNCNVSVTGENFNGITNGMGNLVVRLDTGTYGLIYEMPFGQWQTNLQVKSLTLDQAIEYDTVGFIPIIPSFVGNATITPTWLRCNATARLYANCKNEGNKKSSGRFVVIIDDKTTADYAVPLPDLQDDKRFEWEIKNLSPGQNFSSFIDVSIPGVEFDSLRFLALLITTEGDTISRFNYNGVIRCSYDPNDKRSWPDRIGDENYTLRSERIDYTIRFQNNGNDTAFYVKIVDILDPKLDKKSLILNASSHEVNTYIIGDTLILEHNDIVLPDTASNFIESQGFVSFSFASLPDIDQGSIVFNKGEIIFDQNEPIITNQVKNTIVDALPCPLEAIWIQGQTIQVNAEGMVYEWYDCITNTLVTTTSVPTFIPEVTGSYYAVITGDFCKTVTECVTFMISSTSQTLVNNIRIFPNPNQGAFTISSQEAILNVLISDNMGKQIQNFHYSNDADQRNISIYGLIPGMYVISITTNNNNHLEKVIVR